MEQTKKLNRRSFLKIFGCGVVSATAALYGCDTKQIHEAITAGELDKRTIGNTPIGLWGWSTLQAPRQKNPEMGRRELDEEALRDVVESAFTKGVNLFATSPSHQRGTTQRALGQILQRHRRGSYFIATEMPDIDEPTLENSIAAYKALFTDLGVDRIDFLTLAARPERRRNQTLEKRNLASTKFHKRFIDNGFIEFISSEREAGRIGHIGWDSSSDAVLFDTLLASDFEWDYVRMPINYLAWNAPHAKFNVKTLADRYAEVKARGLKVMTEDAFAGDRLSKLNDRLAGALKEAAPQRSIASWAVRFAADHKAVFTVLSSSPYEDQVQDQIASLSPLQPLTKEEFEALHAVVKPLEAHPLIPCVECQRCMPCPYGLDIPEIFAHYNRCVNEGFIASDRQQPQYREARRAFLIGYDRSVPRLAQADHCISCEKCVSHCPMAIDIPKEMRRVNRYVEQLKQGTL